MRVFPSLVMSLFLGAALVVWPEVSLPQNHALKPLTFENTPPDSALTQVLLSLPGHQLSLEEALRLAEQTSPVLGVARASERIAEAAVLEQKGFYDPEVFAEIRVEDSATPTASVFAGADIVEEQATLTSFGARTRLTLGTSIEASVDSRKSETNDSFRSLNPQYTTTGRLEIRQPLLSGFGPSSRAPLTTAEQSLIATQHRTDDAMSRIRAATEIGYWELYAAERDYAVQTLVVGQAASVLRQAELRAEAGLIGPNQVATARVFLAQQQLALLDRTEGLDAASDLMAEIVGARPSSQSRYRTVFAQDPLSPAHARDDGNRVLEGSLIDVLSSGLNEEDFLARALDSNSNLQAAEADLEALRAAERGARWGMLPRLDLVGSLGGNGLSGHGQPIVFGGDTLITSIDGGLGDALREAIALDHRAWSVGLEFSLPLGLRSERGRRDRWTSEVRRQEQRIEGITRDTENQIRDALRRMRHGGVRLDLAQAAVAAAREQVRIGLIEFNNGRTTAFELVRLGADLATTQRELSRSVVGTATARAELKQLMGVSGE